MLIKAPIYIIITIALTGWTVADQPRPFLTGYGLLNSVKEQSMANEVWKDIEGYEGWYQVSNLGRIKSLKRIHGSSGKIVHREIIKKLSPDRRGYLMVGLKRKTTKVSRLVAKAFIENPLNKPEVNHKNGIKTDNCADNLEWVTCRENIIHARDNGLTRPCHGELSPEAKLSNTQAREIRELAKTMKRKDIVKKYGVSKNIIDRIVAGQTYKLA